MDVWLYGPPRSSIAGMKPSRNRCPLLLLSSKLNVGDSAIWLSGTDLRVARVVVVVTMFGRSSVTAHVQHLHQESIETYRIKDLAWVPVRAGGTRFRHTAQRAVDGAEAGPEPHRGLAARAGGPIGKSEIPAIPLIRTCACGVSERGQLRNYKRNQEIDSF